MHCLGEFIPFVEVIKFCLMTDTNEYFTVLRKAVAGECENNVRCKLTHKKRGGNANELFSVGSLNEFFFLVSCSD